MFGAGAMTNSIAELPQAPLFLIANEFFDALPIRQFIRADNGWRERRIGETDGQLQFGTSEAVPVPALDHRLGDTSDGDLVETCAAGSAIAAEIAPVTAPVINNGSSTFNSFWTITDPIATAIAVIKRISTCTPVIIN